MAGASLYRDEGANAITDINVTPLVDVMLVLLIIFMVTAPMIAARGITIQSPKMVAGDSMESRLKLTIDADRKWYLGGVPYPDRAALRSEIERARRQDPTLKAIIAADVTVPHGDVMDAIDLIKVAGIEKFALANEKKRTPDAP